MWWQLTVHATSQDVALVEDALLELGALAITLSDAKDEPIYEPLPGQTPLWSESLITGLFDENQSIEKLYDALVKDLPDSLATTIKQQKIEDQIWERAHLDYFKPTLFGKNLWIIPSWHDPEDLKGVNISLDPGVAFGTGSHPTTALCLEWLDAHPPKNKTVIDFGCGSGILGIAASLLGAQHVVFTDIDPQALESTKSNTTQNKIEPSTISLYLPHQIPQQPVDVVLANILSGPLIELENHLAALVKPTGNIVLSGLLPEQADDIVAEYSQHFTCDKPTENNGWMRITGIRNSHE